MTSGAAGSSLTGRASARTTVLRKLTILLVLAAAALYFVLVSDTEPHAGMLLWDPGAETESGQEIATLDIEPPEHTAGSVEEPPALATGVEVRGRVLRVDGSPVEGVRVALRHPYLRSTPVASAADGTFALTVEDLRGELAATGDAWLLLGGERFLAPGHVDGYTVVIAPSVALSGRVVDRRGTPLRGVAVRAVAPSDALVPLGLVAKPLEDPGQSAVSDARGAFQLEAVPVLPGTRIEAALVGYETVERPFDAHAGDVVLVMAAH